MPASPDGVPTPDAIEALSATVQAGLEIVASRRLDNAADVEEVVQEAIARTLEAARGGRIPDGVSFGAYAGGVLRHVVADHLRDADRHRGRGAPVDPDTLPAPERDPLQRLVGREDAARLRRALARLSAGERRLLRSIFVAGERVADIARRTAEPAERVRQRKFRALRRLRTLLDGEPPVTDGAPARQEVHEHG